MTHVKPERIVDFTKLIAHNPLDPSFMRVKIRHRPHWVSRWLVRALGLPFKLFPKDFAGWADDTITKMGVHSTTHIDAPWHYGPKLGDGSQSAAIHEMPLDLCFGPGVKFDMRHKGDGEEITVRDLEDSVRTSGAMLKKGTIALIQTGRDRFQGSKDYWRRGAAVTALATEWLIDNGVQVMGVDQWGWDGPFSHQIERAKQTNDPTVFWQGHLVGRRKPYWQMEQLRGLDQVPSHGFDVGVFPLPLKGASAAPARVVGFLY